MIDNSKVKEIIEYCKTNNMDVTARDVAYVAMTKVFEDSLLAYKVIFGMDSGFNIEYANTYDSTTAIVFLKQYISSLFIISCDDNSRKKKKKTSDISFDENKEYMLQLRKDTEEAMRNGDIAKKDGLVILKDISVKLTDKFNVSESSVEQVVFVNQKYTDICSYCGHEIAPRPISKEEAKKMYNLIEKQ